MKQVVIRLIAAGTPVYDVRYGEIVDGHFCDLDLADLPCDLLPHITISNLLGTNGYITAEDLLGFVSDIVGMSTLIGFYGNFIVFNIDPDHVTKEEE